LVYATPLLQHQARLGAVTGTASPRIATPAGWRVLQRHQLVSLLKIPEQVLANYLTLAEEHYHSDVPYHNSLHAADVTQSAHVLASRPALRVRPHTRSASIPLVVLVLLVSK